MSTCSSVRSLAPNANSNTLILEHHYKASSRPFFGSSWPRRHNWESEWARRRAFRIPSSWQGPPDRLLRGTMASKHPRCSWVSFPPAKLLYLARSYAKDASPSGRSSARELPYTKQRGSGARRNTPFVGDSASPKCPFSTVSATALFDTRSAASTYAQSILEPRWNKNRWLQTRLTRHRSVGGALQMSGGRRHVSIETWGSVSDLPKSSVAPRWPGPGARSLAPSVHQIIRVRTPQRDTLPSPSPPLSRPLPPLLPLLQHGYYCYHYG